MKIEIADEIIDGIADRIRHDVHKHIIKTVRELEDKGLLLELRLSNATNKEKVLVFLQRTNLHGGEKTPRAVVVRSEYIREGLGLHPHAMKPVRDQLEAERTIWTRRESLSGLLIYYRPT